MIYSYSKRNHANRATLTINGVKIGRVHFRSTDAWLNPYLKDDLKSAEELGMNVEKDPSNNSFPIKNYVSASSEAEVASILSQAFYNLGLIIYGE